MEIGFNNDVIYRGVTFHIQTEDHGGVDTRVSTHLFLSGQVLDSKTVDYGHLLEGLEGAARVEKIRKVMVSAHKALYNKLFNGGYDHAIEDDAPAVDPVESAPPEEFVPTQERVPKGAQVLEEDGKVTFTFDSGEAVDLKALSQQLSEMDVFPPDTPTGTKGGHDFAELMFEVNTGDIMTDELKVTSAQAPPIKNKVSYESTGQRAFQGLVEQAPDMSVIDQVSIFLDGLKGA